MAAEVVHHQMDRLGFWILQGQVEQDLRELKSRPIRGGEGEMASRFGLYGAEDIGGAAAFIFVIPPRFPSGCRRRRGSHIGVQGDRLLIQADYRFLLVIRPFVYLQDVFHLGDVFFIEVGHHPHFFPATV